MEQKEIAVTEALARKVLEVVGQGLVMGKGSPEPGKMCVEAAVCYALGLPHNDNPPCVGSSVRAFKINLNDSCWSSEMARAGGMKRLAIAQLGSNSIDQAKFVGILTLKTITKLLSTILRGMGYSDKALWCQNAKTLQEAEAAAHDAIGAAHNAARAAAWAAAEAARAAQDAARAVRAAAWAARAAARAAAWEAGDRYLLLSSDIALQALIECNSPGCAFLHLCEESGERE